MALRETFHAGSRYSLSFDKATPQELVKRRIAIRKREIPAAHRVETPEFQRQNREFVTAVKQAGKPVTCLVVRGYNHFEALETTITGARSLSKWRCGESLSMNSQAITA